jgi:hypothetical protein
MLFRAGCQTSEVLETSEVSAVARSRRWWVVLWGYGGQSVISGVSTQLCWKAKLVISKLRLTDRMHLNCTIPGFIQIWSGLFPETLRKFHIKAISH